MGTHWGSGEFEGRVWDGKRWRSPTPEERAERHVSGADVPASQRPITTVGFNFEGHRITRYLGYVSGDAATEVQRGGDGLLGSDMTAMLARLRATALTALQGAARERGGNAVIGISFDYPQLEQAKGVLGTGKTAYLPYLFGVIANGTAGIIEPPLDEAGSPPAH